MDRGNHKSSPCVKHEYLPVASKTATDDVPEEGGSIRCVVCGRTEPRVTFYVEEDQGSLEADPCEHLEVSQDLLDDNVTSGSRTQSEQNKILQTSGTLPVLLGTGEGEEDSRKAPEKPAVPDGGWGWLVVLGCALMHLTVGGYTRSFGVIFIKLQEKFDSSAALTAWVGGLCTAFRFIAGRFLLSVFNVFIGKSMNYNTNISTASCRRGVLNKQFVFKCLSLLTIHS